MKKRNAGILGLKKRGMSVLNMMLIIIIVLTTLGIVWRLINPQIETLSSTSADSIHSSMRGMLDMPPSESNPQ